MCSVELLELSFFYVLADARGGLPTLIERRAPHIAFVNVYFKSIQGTSLPRSTSAVENGVAQAGWAAF